MSAEWHFNIHDKTKGIPRELNTGVNTRVFGGEQMTVSVVELEPGSISPMHQHPQEQWGFLLRGSMVRILGDERVEMKVGDFWQTPGNIPHGIITGPEGATVIDVFAPPRKEYLKAGSGYGSGSYSDKD